MSNYLYAKDPKKGSFDPILQDAGSLRTSMISSNGVEAGVTQYGYLRVTNEPNAWFTDPLDSLDTTNRWTTKLATGTAAVTNGVLALSSSTTASAYGGVFTQPTFAPNGVNFVAFGLTQSIPNVVQANTLRFWGWGSVQTTPTVAAPIVNGCGFELDAAGVLTAVVYQNGTKSNTVATGVTLVNNTPFYSAVARRSDRIDFYVNNTITPVASILIPVLFVATLPFQAICIAGAVAPAAAAQLNILAFGIADTGQNAQAIADPSFPWRRATVKPASTAAAATDLPLVTALHPSSPLNGQSAHAAAIAGNPVRLGARALSAAYTTLTTGQTADLMSTLQGVLTVRPWTIPELEWSYAAAAGGIINTTDVAIAAAAGAGLRRYISTMTLSNNSATATEVVLKDGATVIWRGMLPANAPNIYIKFENPLRTTANTALNFACITTAAAVYVNAQGHTAP